MPIPKQKRRNPFARTPNSWDTSNDPISSIRMPEKKKRERAWEKKNRAYSYRIPQRLRDEAIEVRESILSIVTFDENGHLRMDRTTVDDVAKALIEPALKKAKEETLTFAPARTGKMKLEWKEAEQGWETPIVLKKVKKKRKKTASKQIVLSYRWSPKQHAEIEALAGEIHTVRLRDNGTIRNNPHRFSVPPGEVVVRLLQRSIKAYKERTLILSSSPETVAQRITGWAER